MKLKGKRVMLSKPAVEKSAIELTPDAQESIDRANMTKWTHLEVFAIGDGVDSIKIGDKVYISKSAIERCEVIAIEEEIKLIVHETDVVLVW